MTTTATRAERKSPPWRQAEQTLKQRLHAARESHPGLKEARLGVLDLRSEENSLLGKLQAPPTTEDPHGHDSVRTRLAAVREKIGPAHQAERTVELEASKAAMREFVPEHSEAASEFTASLAEFLNALEKLMELRDLAMGLRLPLTTKTPFFGLDQMQAIRGQLKHIQSLWAQG